MKDLETLLPMLRKFLNERGLNDVEIQLSLDKLPVKVINETYPKVLGDTHWLGVGYYKRKTIESGKDRLIIDSEFSQGDAVC